MTQPEESEASPPLETEVGRKPLSERFSSPEWAARAAVLAGILGLTAAIITVVKS